MEELTKLQNGDQEIAPANTSAVEFIDCDDQVLTRAALPTEDEIIAELIGEEVVEVEDSQEDGQEDSQESKDNPLTKPTTDKIRDVIEVISSLCNMKIGRVRHFARLDYFARAMACDATRFLLVVSHPCCQELGAAFKETFFVL